MAQIGRVKLAGLRGQAAGQVGIADQGDAVVAPRDLVRLGEFAITALLGREIDDHAAVFHGFDHFGADQPGRGLAGDERGGDDDVHLFGLGREQGHFGGDKFRAHGLGIAARAAALLGKIQHEEFRAHALDLLLDLGAGVEGAHNGAETAGRADRGQARHARADDQDFRGRNLASSRDLTREKTPEMVRGLDHGPVAGDVGHGTQRVHFLRAGDARQAVDRQHIDIFGGQPLHEALVLGGPDKADQGLAVPQ